MEIREINPSDNLAIASIIRKNLKKYKLDIPGTAYFDENLDSLSEFYLNKEERYYAILVDDNGTVVGGVGCAEVDFFESCAELQKLYLDDSVKGTKLGYKLLNFVESKAIELGYERIYLETHSNLDVAIHLYIKSGYKEIERPSAVVHSTMDRFFIKEL